MRPDEHLLILRGNINDIEELKEILNSENLRSCLELGNYFNLQGTSLMYVYDGELFEEIDISNSNIGFKFPCQNSN
jgi:hypothetical protein